jgi:predicted amidohydrolase YtcJ
MKADLILHNARVFTVDRATPWAEAVACAQGRILAVGSNDDVTSLTGSATRVIDVGKRLVLPGLTDAHVHFLHYVVQRQQVCLFGINSLEEVRQRVRRAVEQAPPRDWVQGWGWDESCWDAPPHRRLLDDIAPRTPVVLKRMDMHTWWVNAAALELAGISAETPDPARGCIERDFAGAPTGILREWAAIRLVERHIPQPDKAALLKWLLAGISEAHHLGLTGIHDQRVEQEGQVSFRLFQELRRRGQLDLRVHLNIAAERLAEASVVGLQSGFGDDRLWVGHVKAFADGTMGSQTGLMLEPFEGQPDNWGVAVASTESLAQLMDEAAEAGFSLSVHAIGDRAVRELLDVLGDGTSQTGRSHRPDGLPHRIEHVQLIHPDDLPRLGQYGIVASMQPVHLMTDWPTADRLWGQRSRYAYALRSLCDHGTRLAFGSDAPVAPLNPMLGIYAAVARQDEGGQPKGGWYHEERISVAEAVHGYTMGPAYAAGRQGVSGSISPGKWADLVVLTRDLFRIPAAEIKGTDAYLTIFDGQIVYQQA